MQPASASRIRARVLRYLFVLPSLMRVAVSDVNLIGVGLRSYTQRNRLEKGPANHRAELPSWKIFRG